MSRREYGYAMKNRETIPSSIATKILTATAGVEMGEIPFLNVYNILSKIFINYPQKYIFG